MSSSRQFVSLVVMTLQYPHHPWVVSGAIASGTSHLCSGGGGGGGISLRADPLPHLSLAALQQQLSKDRRCLNTLRSMHCHWLIHRSSIGLQNQFSGSNIPSLGPTHSSPGAGCCSASPRLSSPTGQPPRLFLCPCDSPHLQARVHPCRPPLPSYHEMSISRTFGPEVVYEDLSTGLAQRDCYRLLTNKNTWFGNMQGRHENKVYEVVGLVPVGITGPDCNATVG